MILVSIESVRYLLSYNYSLRRATQSEIPIQSFRLFDKKQAFGDDRIM